MDTLKEKEIQRIQQPLRQERSQREYGIDLLRILSMYFVVALHILGNGGILGESEPMSAAYCTAWFFTALTQCAVNCYALISGYVGLKSKPKYVNIIMLWLQVVFYSVTVVLTAFCINPKLVGDMEIKAALFPVYSRQHWYFSAYFCLFFFMPILNTAVENLKKKQLDVIICSMILIFSIAPTLFGKEPFRLERGYSVLWLVFLYILGAYFKKHGVLAKKSAVFWLILYFVGATVGWGCKMLTEKYQVMIFGTAVVDSNIPMDYISPAILLSSVALFGVFLKIKPSKGFIGIISTLSSVTFGIYIIHTNPFIWMLYENLLTPLLKEPVPMMILTCLGVSILVFLACAVIELVRMMIFKLLHIRKLFMFLEKKIVKDLWRD